MRLVLCEKPSQGRDIAKFLGATQRGDGFLSGPGVTVTWARGHLLETAEPEVYGEQYGKPWRTEVLPLLPQQWKLVVKADAKAQFAVINRLLKQVDEVVIATDADREGEVIARELLDYCKFQGRIFRLWMSALDDASIRAALSDLWPSSRTEALYYAGVGRNRPGHDGLFKLFLREPDTARDFLAVHLPADIRAQVRLDTLKLEPGSFVDQKLRELHSDVLYSVETAEGHAGYIYCLVEHQSTADRMMAWRMMRYSMAVMDAHLKKGNDTLPVVVPLLFYQGTVRPYPYSTDWMDCFDAPALAREVYSRPWPLVDVSVMEDSDLQSHRRMALLELVQRDIRHRDAASLLRDVVQLIRLAGNTREQVEAVLCYIIYNGMTSESITPFLYELAGEIPEYKELIMGTIAQQLKEEGIQLGIQQGIEQGIEQARLVAQQKLLETAYALLDNGVSLDVVIKSTGLSRETLEQPRH